MIEAEAVPYRSQLNRCICFEGTSAPVEVGNSVTAAKDRNSPEQRSSMSLGFDSQIYSDPLHS